MAGKPGRVNPVVGWVIVIIIAGIVGGTLRTKAGLSGLENLGNPSERVDSIFTKDTTVRIHHWLQGLVAGKEPNLEGWKASVTDQNGRLNAIQIQTRRTAVDLLLHSVTLGIFCPITVHVSTTWFRMKPEPAPVAVNLESTPPARRSTRRVPAKQQEAASHVQEAPLSSNSPSEPARATPSAENPAMVSPSDQASDLNR
jgi:hypothetical protein